MSWIARIQGSPNLKDPSDYIFRWIFYGLFCRGRLCLVDRIFDHGCANHRGYRLGGGVENRGVARLDRNAFAERENECTEKT
jgi:hypothetical protein